VQLEFVGEKSAVKKRSMRKYVFLCLDITLHIAWMHFASRISLSSLIYPFY